MDRPTISNDQAITQAGMTIGTYLSQAIHEIDRRLGEGYAQKHPELIAECIRSQTLDYNSTALVDSLHALAAALRERGQNFD